MALTSYGQETDKQQAEAAGFDNHLVKPVSLETFGACWRLYPIQRKTLSGNGISSEHRVEGMQKIGRKLIESALGQRA